MGIEGTISAAWALYTGVSEGNSPRRRHHCTISIMEAFMCFGIFGMEWHLLALDAHIFAIALHRCNINRTNVSKNILEVTTEGEDIVFSVPRGRREVSPP